MAYLEFTIKISEPFRESLIRRLTDAGCLGVIEQDESIIAYFPGSLDLGKITNELVLTKALLESSGQAEDLTYRHALIPAQDWNESWKKGFVPIDVGERFTILPPWEKKREGRINLIVDPAIGLRNRPS